MALSRDEATEIAQVFAATYQSSSAILFRFERTTTDLYGANAAQVHKGMKAAYLSKQFEIDGRVYQGRLDVPLENIRDPADLLDSLRHEVLGHFGLNTFEPEQKQALIHALIDAREEPSMQLLWRGVESAYANASHEMQAEEVWSAYCEEVRPGMHQSVQIAERGQRAFAETCDVPQRAMTIFDLHDIACMVAQGLQTGERLQQTFPKQALPNYRKNEKTMEAKEPKKQFHEIVAERLIEQLKVGAAPWQRAWRPGQPSGDMPMNPLTGKRYKGINAIHLLAQGRSDSRWMTYKQAASAEAQVRKGERGTPIQYWKFTEEQNKLDANGKPVRDAQGELVKEVVKLERPRMFMAVVFNAEQIDGLPALEQTAERAWEQHERAEAILAASGAAIRHVRGNNAYYSLATDSITLPMPDQFAEASRYYGVALHELGHWTGHSSRLGRDMAHPFGSEGYAREELRAEIASMIIGSELGIGHDPGQHVAYVGSWIKALEDDPMEVFRAAADAEKIHAHVMGFEQVREQSQDQEIHEAAQPIVSERGADETDVARSRTAVSRGPHEMTYRHFASEALVSPAESPGQAWRVSLGEFTAFSNAASSLAALSEVHRTTVSAALATSIEGTSLPPPPEVLAEYPEVVATHRAALAPETLERVDHASQRAESWTFRQLQARNLYEVMEGATLRQIERVTATLESMLPVHGNNPFWQRRELPEIREYLDDFVEEVTATILSLKNERSDEARISNMLRDVRSGFATHDMFNKAVEDTYEIELPMGWTGALRLTPAGQNGDGGKEVEAEAQGREGWARLGYRGQTFKGGVAIGVLDTLTVLEAGAQADEYEKARILAGLRETRVANNPASTSEDLAAAKEARKTAEASALVAAETAAKVIRDASTRNEIGAEQGLARDYISVPHKEKDDAKALGASWDRSARSWYVPQGVDRAAFARWDVAMPGETLKLSNRQYLVVPYGEHEQAKKVGARWDRTAQSWYVGPRADIEKLKQWLPENVRNQQQSPALDPREEFADEMRRAGLQTGRSIFKGEALDHPVMDGRPHRVPVDGGKRGSVDGYYVAFLDGHPAGRIVNHKTGVDLKWKSKGHKASRDDLAELRAKATERLAERELQQSKTHEQTAARVQEQIGKLVQMTQPTPYINAKGIGLHAGMLADKKGDVAYVPAYDTEGKIWTMQYIQPDGKKRFAKAGKKEGCFHVVGVGGAPSEAVKQLGVVPAIVVGEGYATAASLKDQLGYPTVAAFDSGNLPAVVRALREVYPNQPILIAGDDDRHGVMTVGVNAGRSKAEEAARSVGGRAIFPIFGVEEGVYPSDVPLVTPDSYKAHLAATAGLERIEQGAEDDAGRERYRSQLLSDEQLSALDRMKQFTDFNDLAVRSEFGQAGLARQIQAAVAEVQERTPSKERERQRGLEASQDQPVRKTSRRQAVA